MKRKKNYVNNKELYSNICGWITDGRPKPIYKDIVFDILEMIERISTKKNFRDYPFLDDMKGEAMLHCVKALKTYKEEKDNPYGYFTTCIHNAFVQIIKKEKKYVDFKFHLVQDKIDENMKMDRSIIVGYNRNENGDSVDEDGNILTTYDELKENNLY